MSQTVPAFKIAMLPKYCRDGSSSRLRLYQYADSKAFQPFSIDMYPLYEERYIRDLYERGERKKTVVLRAYVKRLMLLLKLFRYDILWVEKELFPRFPAIAEKMLSLFGVRYVVDYDDATFHDYELSKNLIVRKIMGKKIDHVMRYAACVICGNRYIQSRARGAGAKITHVIPTVVDAKKYVVGQRKNKQLTIGWIGAPPTEKYLQLIKTPLIKLLTQHQGRLALIGATKNVRTHFKGINITLLPWSEEKEAELLAQIDIGIMPLKDEPWERGKCGFKLLQYMAAGKPVVASPVGVNVEIVEDSNSGYLAEHDEEWFSKLNNLASNPELREQLGENGRNSVTQYYSLEVQSPRLATILSEIGSQPVKA